MKLSTTYPLALAMAFAYYPTSIAQNVPLELSIISCDPDMTYQDYDVNCLEGGTGVLDCTDPHWGWYSTTMPPPKDCDPGRDRRPFGTLSVEVPCDFEFEIVKTPPGMQQGDNQTMTCHIKIDEWPGTDKVSWWMGRYIQNAYTGDPEAPVPPPYLKAGTVQIGCGGATFD